MGFDESSASEGEIVETTHKANTSYRQQGPAVDNPSRGFGLDGASDLNGKTSTLGKKILAEETGYNNRYPSRSPSPYRPKHDRSPSPYRARPTGRGHQNSNHNRDSSRSPSPYRARPSSRGHQGSITQSHKRKASPHRHGRPEKRYNSNGAEPHSHRKSGPHDRTHRNGGQHEVHGRNPRESNQAPRTSGPDRGNRTPGQGDHGRAGTRQTGANDNRRNRNEHDNSNPSFNEERNGTNGYQPNANSHTSRSNARTFHEPVDLTLRDKDPHADRSRTGQDGPRDVDRRETDTHADTNHVAQDEPDYTVTPAAEDKIITEESREEKKRRWAAKRAQAQLAAASTNLLQHALITNASEATTPNVSSPGMALDAAVSPTASTPRMLDSVPPSPDVMVVDKDEGVGENVSSPADGPSAANYDPTQDMLDDRNRAEQKAQQTGVSASSYDETNPSLLSTLPAAKSGPAKKKKKEIDMFAFSDEEDEGDQEAEDEEEQTSMAKGTVLDAKLLDNWDDPDGYYKIISNELVNAGRYRMVKPLGRGVFANVAQAEDVKEEPGRLVAVKIIRRNDAMKKASLKEMEFLQRLNEADPQDKRHIIRFLGTFDHKGHLCIVFEHMSKNLRDLLKEETSGHGLSLQAVKTYLRQMIIGLKHLQDCQIIHADLKPDNILVSLDKKTVKLCDLGTAADKRDNSEPTPYLVSRFYRAPEIILGMEIGYPVDMWAIGCTAFELWTGKILFPGRSNNQMIRVIMECMGWPTEKLLKKGLLSGQHFEQGPPLKFISREVDQLGNVRLPLSLPSLSLHLTALLCPSTL